MKKLSIISILILFANISFFNCDTDKKTIINENSNNGPFDWTTMLTPDGGKLKSAEEGPIRSALVEPTINLVDFQLEIRGLVDSSFFLTWDEIRALPAVYSDTILMYCVEGWEVFGNWKGILVGDLLGKAHVQPEGKYILFGCADGYTTTLPISYLLKYNAMLAYEVNDLPLKVHDGFPLRLIAFGQFGYKWAKWVNKIEVMNQSRTGYWESYGYPDRADVPVTRRSYYEGKNAPPLEY
jgi:DMSO/TMAO reductase YedYZ molybdopterin-dependent catalytic subunit